MEENCLYWFDEKNLGVLLSDKYTKYPGDLRLIQASLVVRLKTFFFKMVIQIIGMYIVTRL